MWPILALSIVAVGTVLERVFFLVQERARRKPGEVEKLFSLVERGEEEKAVEVGRHSSDFVARTLAHGLAHRDRSFVNALLHAARKELDHYSRGLIILDTAVTLGPLLGLLGTVTGMMSAFGMIGGGAIGERQAAITGGIAEALIAVAFGLGVAIVALIPFNYLNGKTERARRQLEDASNHLEILLAGKEK